MVGDPAVEANAGILVSWAGAAWRACGPAQHRRRTDPNPVLLDNAIKKADKGLRDGGYRWDNVKGPAGGVIMTARRLGWRVLSGFRVEDERGGIIDLGITDPRGVRIAVERATRDTAAAKAAAKAGLDRASGGVWMAPVHRFIGSKGTHPAAKAAFRRAFAGGFWTRSRRVAAGIGDDCTCELCGHHLDDLYHRCWECEAIKELREKHTSQEMRDAAARARRDDPRWTRGLISNPCRTVPPPRRDYGEKWFFAPGVPTEQFFGGTVYTDESALNPQCPDVRRAGWAVVQIDAKGAVMKAVYGHLPAALSMDQTVAGGELHALRRATELSVGPLVIKTDDQGAIDGFNAGEAACVSQRRPNAASWRGFWRARDDDGPRLCKVKAHRSKLGRSLRLRPRGLGRLVGQPRGRPVREERGQATCQRRWACSGGQVRAGPGR